MTTERRWGVAIVLLVVALFALGWVLADADNPDQGRVSDEIFGTGSDLTRSAHE